MYRYMLWWEGSPGASEMDSWWVHGVVSSAVFPSTPYACRGGAYVGANLVSQKARGFHTPGQRDYGGVYVRSQQPSVRRVYTL